MKFAIRFSVLLCVLPILAFAQTPAASFAKPGVITTVGQSADGVIVKILLNQKLKMGLEYDTAIKAEALGDAKTLIMVVGASSKGLGAAGISMDQEIERTKALLKAAKDKGIRIILAHTGGESRRGGASNGLIDLVGASADAIVVTQSGNKDGYFDRIAESRGIPLLKANNLTEAGAAIKSLFGE